MVPSLTPNAWRRSGASTERVADSSSSNERRSRSTTNVLTPPMRTAWPSETSSSPTPGRRSVANSTSSCDAACCASRSASASRTATASFAASPGVVVDAAPSSMSSDLLVDHQLLRGRVVLVGVQGLLPGVGRGVVLDRPQAWDRHAAQLLGGLAEAGNGQVLAGCAGKLREEGDVLARGASRRLVVGRARLGTLDDGLARRLPDHAVALLQARVLEVRRDVRRRRALPQRGVRGLVECGTLERREGRAHQLRPVVGVLQRVAERARRRADQEDGLDALRLELLRDRARLLRGGNGVG